MVKSQREASCMALKEVNGIEQGDGTLGRGKGCPWENVAIYSSGAISFLS